MKRKILQRILSLGLAVSMLLTFVTVTTASSSMKPNVICGFEEHIHDDGCYEPQYADVPACSYVIHRHDDTCYDSMRALVCGQQDFVLHQHDELCYQDGALTCLLDEVWLEFIDGLVCELDHEHEDVCYGQLPVLYRNGNVVSFENDDMDFGSHQHDASCFVSEFVGVGSDLICGLTEHTHDEACFEQAFGVPDNSVDVPDDSSDEDFVSDNEVDVDGDADTGVDDVVSVDISAQIDEIQSLIDSLSSGVEDDGFAQRFDSLSVWMNGLDLTAISSEQQELLLTSWYELSDLWQVYLSQQAVLSVLNAFVEAVDKLAADVDAGLYSEDESLFLPDCDRVDALRTQVLAVALTDEQKVAFDAADSKFSALKSLTNINFADSYVTYGFSVLNQVVAAQRDIDFTFQLTPVSDYGDTVVLGESVVSCHGSGNVVFPDVVFYASGTYQFSIAVIPGSEHYRYDSRPWQVDIVISEQSGGLVVEGVTYTRASDSSSRPDRAAFVNTCLDIPRWSSDASAKAKKVLDSMTLEEKVGQLFLLHYPGDGSGTVAQATDIINKYHPGGYLVFGVMFANSNPSAVCQKIADTQAASKLPMLFSVDEEGGRVVRISSNKAFRSSPYLSPQELKANGGLQAVWSDTRDKSAFLSDLGLNVNHAPVADVADSSGYIYGRTWGGDGVDNASYVEAYISASNGTGVGSTMKHFPGYGGTSSDTHFGFAVNYLSLDDFYYNDLLPFYAGMAAGGKSVMVTHNTINCLDSVNPASLSPAVYELLRSDIGFDGVAITDDLAMNAVTSFVGSGQASLRALQAGADMAMTSTPDLDVPVVLFAVNSGSLPIAEVEAKCMRILSWKAELGLLDEYIEELDKPAPVDYDAKYIAADGSFKTGTFDEMMTLAVASGGKVELWRDAKSSKQWTVVKSVELDLQGHTLQYDVYDKPMFTVNAGRHVILNDSVGEITDTVQSDVSAPSGYNVSEKILHYNRIYEESGEISRVADFSHVGVLQSRGGSLAVLKGGSFTLKNGLVDGSNGKYRGIDSAVNASNVVNIEGGALVNWASTAESTYFGGGVYLQNGKLNMSGGYIVNCRGNRTGGGIYMASSAVANLTGGVVGYNYGGYNGGGMYVAAGCTANLSGVVMTGNVSTSNGANVYTINGVVTVAGDTNLTYGQTGNGGGIYSYGGSSVVTVTGDAVIAKNEANSVGGGICIGYGASAGKSLTLSGNSLICDNKAVNMAGGVWADAGSVNIGAGMSVRDNVGQNMDQNFYLRSGQVLNLIEAIAPGMEVYFYTESTNEVVRIVDRSKVTMYDSDLPHFRSDIVGRQAVLQDNYVVFVGSEVADLPAFVILDGYEYQFSSINQVWRTNDGHRYMLLNELADDLVVYGFDFSAYSGEFVIGVQSSSGGDITISELEPFYKDGFWYVYLPDNVSLTESRIFFLPNGGSAGLTKYETVVAENGYYSVRVNDMYGTITEGVADESSFTYVPAGQTVVLDLPNREAPWDWIVGVHDDADFTVDSTVTDNRLKLEISNIHAVVVVTSGNASDARYTVQYFAVTKVLDRYATNDAGNTRLQIIDTSGGVMPWNGAKETDLNMMYLQVDTNAGGSVSMIETVDRVYTDKNYVYSDAPTLIQVDRLYTDNHYSLEELWILKQGRNPESTNRDDWDVYNKTELGLNSIHDLHLTNAEEFAVPNEVIYIGDDTVIRFMYRPTDSLYTAPVMFYDYDITDGSFYEEAEFKTQHVTSDQVNFPKVFVKSFKQGINNIANYDGSGSHFAFGNANTNSGWATELFNGGHFNQYDRIQGTYRGCSFGLVTGLDADGNLVYDSDIVAPKLFDDGDAIGKTAIPDYELQFSRYGDTYTLESVVGTVAQGLTTFNHPVSAGGKEYTHIWTNNFWPADSMPTFGADGHDPKFGNPNQTNWFSSGGAFPEADDGLAHNSYFGMSFNINFALPEGYTGDLEYCFFGDDDLWMFLDGKLILDIGGVHSSVGEYVNLWDYIAPGDTSNHELKLYYTERGASGSTCWMHFTIPAAHFDSETWDSGKGSLKLTKTVEGNSGNPARSYLFDVKILDASGQAVQDDYSYVTYDMSGKPAVYGVLSNGVGTVGLVKNQVLVIPYIESGYQYFISEHGYDCDTRVLFEGSIVEGIDISGVITEGKVNNLEFVNDFTSVPMLPGTGASHTSRQVMLYGTIMILCGIGLLLLRDKTRFAKYLK